MTVERSAMTQSSRPQSWFLSKLYNLTLGQPGKNCYPLVIRLDFGSRGPVHVPARPELLRYAGHDSVEMGGLNWRESWQHVVIWLTSISLKRRNNTSGCLKQKKLQKAPDLRRLLNTWTADVAIAVYIFHIPSQSCAVVNPKLRRRIRTSTPAVFLSTFTCFAAVSELGPLWIVSMYRLC